MSFLKKIDEMHTANKSIFREDELSNTFSSFIPVLFPNAEYRSRCQFLIKKQDKAKLLICIESQRVHLSDIQVIQTIINMDSQTIGWFISEFVLLYKNEGNIVRFEIDSNLFEGQGIKFFSDEKYINLFSDSIIHINDFICLLNFIFLKDRCWEDDEGIKDFSKRTLMKYISLIDYYANKTQHSLDFLSSIDYPISEPNPVENSRTSKIFNRPENFDISFYL